MNIEVFTFGQDHTHVVNGRVLNKDVVAVVTVDEERDPRDEMMKLIGTKFSTSYPEDILDEPGFMSHFPKGLVYISQEDIDNG